MCGIGGILTFSEKTSLDCLVEMSNGIKHRGPDDEGFYVLHDHGSMGSEYLGNDSNKGITNLKHIDFASDKYFKLGLVHRRFSILDISKLGHQPMVSDDDKIVLTFNGEIFNYIELKDQLIRLGYSFNSNSDTARPLRAP